MKTECIAGWDGKLIGLSLHKRRTAKVDLCWFGLDKIHMPSITPTASKDFEGNSRYAHYSSFSVGNPASRYTLSVSGYSGTAGDSLTQGRRKHFSIGVVMVARGAREKFFT